MIKKVLLFGSLLFLNNISYATIEPVNSCQTNPTGCYTSNYPNPLKVAEAFANLTCHRCGYKSYQVVSSAKECQDGDTNCSSCFNSQNNAKYWIVCS